MNGVFTTANGEHYGVFAVLTDRETNSVTLDSNNLIRFEMLNRMGELHPTGTIEYLDDDAKIDKFLDSQYVNCTVQVARYGDKDGVDTIEHHQFGFFVDNIGIIGNEPGKITYELKLIGNTWENHGKEVQYSNYATGPEPILSIMRNILVNTGYPVDVESFMSSGNANSICFITTGNENVGTALDYLYSRMFYGGDSARENSLKFLVYDEYADKIHLFDMAKQKPFQKSFGVQVSQVSNQPSIIDDSPVNIAYVVRKGRSKVSLDTTRRVFWKYDLDKNDFSHNEIESSEIAGLFRSEADSSRVSKMGANNLYAINESTWDNTSDTYRRQMSSLVDNGSLIVNMQGHLGLFPGCGVNVDMRVDDAFQHRMPSGSLPSTKKYDTMDGSWIASSVRTFFTPHKSLFRQNVALVRNWKTG